MDDDLLPLAEAIADGQEIDWERELLHRSTSKQMLHHLRQVECIVAAQRSPGNRITVQQSLGSTPAGGLDKPTHLRSWGPLTIRAQLGQGAFGEVYRAYDPSLDREVALKLLRPASGQDEPNRTPFLSEAQRLARVRHPNVLVVHGVETHDGRVGLWTDLLKGKTLEEYLRQEGTIGAREAALIGIELCHALAAVHKAGLLHRDLKPSNVMREEGGRIVLMDFGSGAELPRRSEERRV